MIMADSDKETEFLAFGHSAYLYATGPNGDKLNIKLNAVEVIGFMRAILTHKNSETFRIVLADEIQCAAARLPKQTKPCDEILGWMA